LQNGIGNGIDGSAVYGRRLRLHRRGKGPNKADCGEGTACHRGSIGLGLRRGYALSNLGDSTRLRPDRPRPTLDIPDRNDVGGIRSELPACTVRLQPCSTAIDGGLRDPLRSAECRVQQSDRDPPCRPRRARQASGQSKTARRTLL
jgi:hypothetical protein